MRSKREVDLREAHESLNAADAENEMLAEQVAILSNLVLRSWCAMRIDSHASSRFWHALLLWFFVCPVLPEHSWMNGRRCVA